MRGRKPKPTHLKLLDGNAGRRPLNIDEPVPAEVISGPPGWMTAAQQKIWRDAVEASPPGLLRSLDSSIFSIWVVARALHQEAAEKVSQYGAIIKSPANGQPIQSPYLGIMNRQAQIMMKAVSEMGFSPTSRARVKIDKPADRDDPFAGIVGLAD
jgi:P27 family predicted phage terminase small subunit